MTANEHDATNLPQRHTEPRLIVTHEGASAFPVDDPFVRLVFNYGSFLPGEEAYYESAETQMRGFIEAVQEAARAHPELALQYAAWQRDPRQGKGNRSQPPWILAVLAGIPKCVEHPRFADLVARAIVRPDDALYIIQATVLWIGDNRFPAALLQGIARGLDGLSDYQLTKYANAALNLLPTKKKHTSKRALPAAQQHESNLPSGMDLIEQAEKLRIRSLRLVDVLGICKGELSPRLFALYRYLHAPTRQQAELLPLLEDQLPLFGKQKELRQHPPRQVVEVAAWVEQALEARMTIEQMFSATGMESGQRQQLRKLRDIQSAPTETTETKAEATKKPQPTETETTKQSHKQGLEILKETFSEYFQQQETERQQREAAAIQQQAELLRQQEPILQQQEAVQQAIRTELWRALMHARIPGELDEEQRVPLIGDVAFLRNVRGMYQAGIPLTALIAEVQRRQFRGIWPFQLLSAARAIEMGRKRGDYQSRPCKEVLPALNAIFEKVALTTLPKKEDGTHYHILGLADVSGSMTVELGSKQSSATCMDASLSFSTAFSYTSANRLAGSWGNKFYPFVREPDEGALDLSNKIRHSGGMGGNGTQVFGSMLHLINWLRKNPEMQPPEVLVVLSDMQFTPPKTVASQHNNILPIRYQALLDQPAFSRMPPLAAAIALYREILGREVSLVLWNLANYQGAPVPSGMERVLMLSGFDTNSFHIIEQWLQAGSPGSAMPVDVQNAPAGDGQSNASFEAVLAELRRY